MTTRWVWAVRLLSATRRLRPHERPSLLQRAMIVTIRLLWIYVYDFIYELRVMSYDYDFYALTTIWTRSGRRVAGRVSIMGWREGKEGKDFLGTLVIGKLVHYYEGESGKLKGQN